MVEKVFNSADLAVQKYLELNDPGVKALMATGTVPEGYHFKTNISRVDHDFPDRDVLQSREEALKQLEEEGYEVMILPTAFDSNGDLVRGCDAIVAKKITS